jgi:hypothetical protein
MEKTGAEFLLDLLESGKVSIKDLCLAANTFHRECAPMSILETVECKSCKSHYLISPQDAARARNHQSRQFCWIKKCRSEKFREKNSRRRLP